MATQVDAKPTASSRARTLMEPLWADRRVGAAVALAVAVGCGLLLGWWTPRGPLTTAESLGTMLLCLLVGAAVGFLLRSRWAMLAAPVVVIIVFELTRIGTDGPTVDEIATSPYGIFAFIVGRGFHALVALPAMILGAALGAGAARRLTRIPGEAHRASAGVVVRRAVAALTAVALIALAVVLARPAGTAPIEAADGEPAPNSIAELTTVESGGKDLGLMLRGADVENPVLLFLAGGPGGSELGAMRNHLQKLEEYFVVATLDQRGTGTSYPELDPASTLTLESSVEDAISVTNTLRERFDEEKIYLMGQSGGTVYGVLAVQQEPELYHAYIGTGQMVSPLETDTIFYEDTLLWAEQSGDAALVEELERIGPPPYEDMLDYETALAYEHQVYPYDHTGNSEGEGGFSENFLVPEYTLTDQIHLLGSFMDTFSVIYPQLQDTDFRTDVTTLDVPVYFVQGAHEARGRAEPFAEWFELLEAPVKETTELSTSGHRPLFEQPDEFVAYLRDTVLVGTPPS
ncbi:alpha/beta hydrolase [Arthrobacter pityocampae]|uniref:Alpha/beta hydrolase n=1 Tax=Arthrobacter pityocampae TaxID=547334 RepID=A0A2S5ITY0_9MICC|nr:alpha/beta hydrolase [Arthrobacter pityocampae]PPB48018.1 alpha/beta hydrolase [Arthrobacter pityocampae]